MHFQIISYLFEVKFLLLLQFRNVSPFQKRRKIKKIQQTVSDVKVNFYSILLTTCVELPSSSIHDQIAVEGGNSAVFFLSILIHSSTFSIGRVPDAKGSQPTRRIVFNLSNVDCGDAN